MAPWISSPAGRYLSANTGPNGWLSAGLAAAAILLLAMAAAGCGSQPPDPAPEGGDGNDAAARGSDGQSWLGDGGKLLADGAPWVDDGGQGQEDGIAPLVDGQIVADDTVDSGSGSAAPDAPDGWSAVDGNPGRNQLPPNAKCIVDQPGPKTMVGANLTVRVASKLSDGTALLSASVQANGKMLGKQAAAKAAALWTEFSVPTASVPEPIATFVVTCHTALGDQATFLSLKVDHTPPVITIVKPTPGIAVGTIEMEATVADKYLSAATASLAGKVQGTTHSAGKWLMKLSVPPGLKGAQPMTVAAVDAAGNTAEATVSMVIIPTPSMPAPQTDIDTGAAPDPAKPNEAAEPAKPIWLDVGDLDGDGDVDVVAATAGGNAFFWNQGKATFKQTVLKQKGGSSWVAFVPLKAKLANNGAPVRFFASLLGDGKDGGVFQLIALVDHKPTIMAERKMSGDISAVQMMSTLGKGKFAVVYASGDNATNAIGVMQIAIPPTVPVDAAGGVTADPAALAAPKLFPGVGAIGKAKHGDLNGDGLDDLIFGRVGPSVITTCLADGKGGFDTCTDTMLFGEPSPVAALPVQLDDTGVVSLVVASQSTSSLMILVNDGSGVFKVVKTIPLATAPEDLTFWPKPKPLGTVLVTGSSNSFFGFPVAEVAQGCKCVGVPCGAAEPPQQVRCPVGSVLANPPKQLLVADFDGDGEPDALSFGGADAGFQVLTSDTSGQLKAPIDLPICLLAPNQVGSQPAALAVADMDGDGKLDLAIGGSPTNSVKSACADGAGDPQAGPVWLYSAVASALVDDVTYAEYAPHIDGKSGGPAGSCNGEVPAFKRLFAVDANGDGKRDLVAVTDQGYALSMAQISPKCGFQELNEVNSHYAVGGLSPCAVPNKEGQMGPGGGAPLERASAVEFLQDASGLGFLDTWYPKSGLLSPAFAFAAGVRPVAADMADVDGDGLPDLATVMAPATTTQTDDFMPGRVRVFRNKGTSFEPLPQMGEVNTTLPGGSKIVTLKGTWLPTGLQPMDLALHGAKPTARIHVLNGASQNILVYKAALKSVFPTPGIFLTVGGEPTAFAVGDANGDGETDMVSAREGWLVFAFGKANGSFGSGLLVPIAPGLVSAIAIGNFNDDDQRDIALAYRNSNRVALLLGLPDGTFLPLPGLLMVNRTPVALRAADLNGDGVDDLLVRCQASRSVTLLLSAK